MAQAPCDSCGPLPPGIDSLLRDSLARLSFAFVLADCSKPDMPICFASSQFYDMTGYGPDEVLGRNCRFLQGPATERRKVLEIRDAIREDRCCQVCLTNHRKDGSPFLNQFYLAPIKDDQGIVTHYIGIQTDVSTVAGQLGSPQALPEQQAALAFGSAAGCRMCDMMLQPEAVAAQLQASQAGEAGQQAGQQQQQQQAQQALSDEETDVVAQEAAHAVEVCALVQQTHPHAQCTLPSSLLQPLMKLQQSFVLSDPRLPDCPIVFASESFLELTGYAREDVVGRNCRFLQGPDSQQANASELGRLRAAMAADPPSALTVTLLNYTKTGRPFWNALHIAPVRDADGRLEFFIGVQLDVSSNSSSGSEAGGGAAAAAAAPAAVPPPPDKLHLSQRMAHHSVAGAVRVACRGLSGARGGLRRSLDNQGLVRRGYAMRRHSSSSGHSTGSGGGMGAAAAAALQSVEEAQSSEAGSSIGASK